MGSARTTIEIAAPFAGHVALLADVPDPVYAAGAVGIGLAIAPDPEAGQIPVLAPCSGVVRSVYPHAVMIVGDSERAVLVHLGVGVSREQGTVEMVQVGAHVSAGDPVLSWCPSSSGAAGTILSPLVALQADVGRVVAVAAPGEHVTVGQSLLFWS